MASDKTPTVIFLDDLPKVSRGSEGGNSKYLPAVEQLRTNPNKWGYIAGPVTNPYGITNNLNQGSVSGVSPEEFEFTTRTLDAAQAKAAQLTPPTTEKNDKGEDVDVNGYVFGRHITGKVAEEVQAKRAERREKMAATRKANASK